MPQVAVLPPQHIRWVEKLDRQIDVYLARSVNGVTLKFSYRFGDHFTVKVVTNGGDMTRLCAAQ